MIKEHSEEILKRIRKLRPIDDVFFRLLANKVGVCEEILCTILDDPGLKVLQTNPQQAVSSFNRSIILDVLCELGNGDICNIEVQKGLKNNDLKRVRFHASVVTTHYTPKGTEFADIPDVCIVYITDYDALKNNQTCTEVRRCQQLGNAFVPVEDGERIFYINSVIDDGTDKAELMKLFNSSEVFQSKKFQNLSDAVRYFKEGKGVGEMCTVIEDYAAEQVNETLIEVAKNFLAIGNSVEDVSRATGLPIEQVQALLTEIKQD